MVSYIGPPRRRAAAVLTFLATASLAAILAGCGSDGMQLADRWEIFQRGNGEAALAAPPSTDLVDYLPSATAEADATASPGRPRTRPTAVLAGTITAVTPAFGFRHADAPSSGRAVKYDDLEEGDFRVVEITLSVRRVVAGEQATSGDRRRTRCVLMLLGDARAALSDLEALVGDRSPTWYPVSKLDSHSGAFGGTNDPLLASYRARGCEALFDNAVFRPDASGAFIERLGPWDARIDHVGARPLRTEASSSGELEDIASAAAR